MKKAAGLATGGEAETLNPLLLSLTSQTLRSGHFFHPQKLCSRPTS